MNELERLLQEKLRLLGEIRKETGRQGELIAAQDPEGLLQSVADRQAAMDALDALEKKLSGNAGGGVAVERLKSAIVDELNAIIQMDDENRKNAGGMAMALMSGIKQSNTAKTLRAYQGEPRTSYRYVNKKG